MVASAAATGWRGLSGSSPVLPEIEVGVGLKVPTITEPHSEDALQRAVTLDSSLLTSSSEKM